MIKWQLSSLTSIIQAQREINIGNDIHGVRFDIFVLLEDGRTIEIEMQVVDTGNLPKRLRFYSSLADIQMLEKGDTYSSLGDSYTIMICPFDPYGKGLHKYTFTNRCHEEEGLEMGDGTVKIVLNAKGTADDVSGGLKAFLDYVAGKPSDDEYVRRLDKAVKKAKANKEWRREYMVQMMRDLENRELGRKEGIGIGRKDATELINYLWSNGRGEEAQMASKDNVLLEKLLAEYKSTKTT